MTLTVGKSTLRGALILLAFAVTGTLLLASTFEATREPIARAEEAARMRLLNQVLPPEIHDNDLLQDTVSVPADPRLGTTEAAPAFRARRGGELTGVALEAIAANGYGGKIRLVMGIAPDGRLLGVRVVAHSETPGLGDYIEIDKSDWIRAFDDRRLTGDGREWRVKKDGGAFDSMAGATITPRAVVEAVRRALEYFAAHRAALTGADDGAAPSKGTS
jgi:electron transport complex protein RnfG